MRFIHLLFAVALAACAARPTSSTLPAAADDSPAAGPTAAEPAPWGELQLVAEQVFDIAARAQRATLVDDLSAYQGTPTEQDVQEARDGAEGILAALDRLREAPALQSPDLLEELGFIRDGLAEQIEVEAADVADGAELSASGYYIATVQAFGEVIRLVGLLAQATTEGPLGPTTRCLQARAELHRAATDRLLGLVHQGNADMLSEGQDYQFFFQDQSETVSELRNIIADLRQAIAEPPVDAEAAGILSQMVMSAEDLELLFTSESLRTYGTAVAALESATTDAARMTAAGNLVTAIEGVIENRLETPGEEERGSERLEELQQLVEAFQAAQVRGNEAAEAAWAAVIEHGAADVEDLADDVATARAACRP